MTDVIAATPPLEDQGTAARAFLIADIRGYSTFTRERGHDEAAKLAATFVDLAGDAVEANGGRIVEIRGDEVFAVFSDPVQAARAGIDLQLACAEESATPSGRSVPAGVGIDVGESVREGVQYHSSHLNMAARLCSRALAGEVLVTRDVADACAGAPDLRLQDRGSTEFKGFDRPTDVVAVAAVRHATPPPLFPEPALLPPDLDVVTPMVGRDREVHWLRGTWRRVRRGNGRVVVVSGPAGIGKGRLAAELAVEVATFGGGVAFAGPGGTATADALSALRGALAPSHPTLLVLDQLDAVGNAPVHALTETLDAISTHPVMVVCLVREADSNPALAELAHRIGATGHRTLGPLGPDGVREIARVYAGDDLAAVPMESIVRASEGMPGRVHEVMAEWARTQAARRLSAAAEYLSTGRLRRSADLEFANNVIGLKLGQLYSVTAVAESADGEVCPFKGLASFDEQDAAYFFGRERLVGELAARTVGAGLLGVVGDSGSGKSSVVAAGLLPSLRAGVLPGSDQWRSLTMRPGERPLEELRGVAGGSLDDAIGAVDADSRLVLFVDQFEEVFTNCTDDEERDGFVSALTRAAREWPERSVAIVAMRGDFYGRCARYAEFGSLLTANHVLVGPMSTDELRRAIELPARRAGLRVESALVDALVDEVADEPGALPLLSTTLAELWQAREAGWLRLEAYEASGGLRGAVARLAEGTYEELSEPERDTARRIFLRLVGPGEGDAVTRRRAQLSELDVEQDAVAASVLGRLTRDRLLTVSETTVEAAHEALLREWPRLRGWIEEDAQGQQLRQHLTVAARQWDQSGREASELYRGARLSATLDWTATHGSDPNALEREFVSQSRQANEREAQRLRRTNRRLRSLVVGVALFLIVALVAGSLALVQRGQAKRSATKAQTAAAAARHSAIVATSRSLGANAIANPQLDTAVLLAVQGVRFDDSVQTENDLLTTLLKGPSAVSAWHVGKIGASPGEIAVSPDGKTLAIVTDALRFFDAATRQQIGQPVKDVSAGCACTIAFTPDGSQLAATAGDSAEMIDVSTHRVLTKFLSPPDPGGAYQLTLSPDGTIAYATSNSFSSGGAGPYVWRWDAATGKRLPPALVTANPHLDPASWAVVAQRTGQLVSLSWARGGLIQVRDGRTLALEHSFHVPVPASAASFLAVSPDGDTAMYTSYARDSSIRFVDLRTGAVRVGSGGQGGQVTVAFGPDGRTAASTTPDDNILIWDVRSASVTKTLKGHSGNVGAITFSPDGDTLYSGGDDGNVFTWDLTGRRGFGHTFVSGKGSWTPDGLQHVCGYFSATPDGRTLAFTEAEQHPLGATSKGGDINLVDVATGRLRTSFPVSGRVPGVESTCYAQFSPDGHELLVNPAPAGKGTVSLWSLEPTPRLIRTFVGLQSQFTGFFGGSPWATFSPDGRWVAGADAVGKFDRKGNLTDTTVHVMEWSATTGALRAPPLVLQHENVQNVSFSAEGRYLAVNLSNDVAVIDAASLKIVHRFPDKAGPAFVTFAPAGHVLASGNNDGSVAIWDTSTWKSVGTFQAATDPIKTVAFDPDGRRILVRSFSTTTLWMVPSLQQIGPNLPGVYPSWGAAGFAGRGSSMWMISATGAGPVAAFPASVSGWERAACAVAGRNLTRAEWKQYGNGQPYQKTCPQFP